MKRVLLLIFAVLLVCVACDEPNKGNGTNSSYTTESTTETTQSVQQPVSQPTRSAGYDSGNHYGASQNNTGGKNDLFLTILASPNATPDDMIIAGMTPENTILKTRAEYRDDERVREHFTDDNGSVDFEKMDAAYDYAQSVLRYMSNTSFDEAMKKQLTFHRDDYSVPYEMTRKGPDYKEIQVENPDGKVSGLIRLGEVK